MHMRLFFTASVCLAFKIKVLSGAAGQHNVSMKGWLTCEYTVKAAVTVSVVPVCLYRTDTVVCVSPTSPV